MDAEKFVETLKRQWELDRKKKLNPKKEIPYMQLITQSTVSEDASQNLITQSRDLREGLVQILIASPHATLTLTDIKKVVGLLDGSIKSYNNGYQLFFGRLKEFFEVAHGKGGDRHILTRLWVKRIATAIYVAVKLGYIDKSMLKYFPSDWEHRMYSGRLLHAIK